MQFTDLGLSKNTVRAIEQMGIGEPTTVQIDVIPSILEGKDIFAIAPQGCGKTCSYIFPLIDIISRKKEQTILILTADSNSSASISDRLSVFNRYHYEHKPEDNCKDANVIIATPDLLLDLPDEQKQELAKTSILIVDDINLIKKQKQLKNLEKVLTLLPRDKQNIVYTNRRSQETQEILEKILQSPQEVKIDKNKESEATSIATEVQPAKTENKPVKEHCNYHKENSLFVDNEAIELIKKYNTFAGKTPKFLTIKGILVTENNLE